MEHRSTAARFSILAILHALAWAFAMLLADGIWGDRVSQAMVYPFLIANTVLAIALTFALKRGKSNIGQ